MWMPIFTLVLTRYPKGSYVNCCVTVNCESFATDSSQYGGILFSSGETIADRLTTSQAEDNDYSHSCFPRHKPSLRALKGKKGYMPLRS